MPVIEVLNLSMLVPGEVKRLQSEIIEAITSMEIPGLEDETNLVILFPLCAFQYDKSITEKLVKIWGLEDTTALSISREPCQKFAEKVLDVVKKFFKDDRVRCYVNRHQDGQDGYWITEK